MNFQTKKQVEEHIKDTLLKSASFNIKEVQYVKKQNTNNENNDNGNDNKRIMLVESDDDNEVQVYHLIMAREETEAGDYYNIFTYQFLQEHFNLFTERKPLSIIEEIKTKFVEWSYDLLEDSISEDNIQIVEDEKGMKFIYKECDNKNENHDKESDNKNENENKNHNKESDNKNENHKITPKACISDELGLSIYRSNGYDPPYYFYIENEEKLVVVLEMPGNPEETKIEDIYADTDVKEIIVKGNKSNGNDSKKKLYNNTKFGKFNLHIPYGNKILIADEIPIENEDSYKDGIYTYKFRLIKKRKHANRK